MIEHVIPQRRRDLGGFEVGRVLPHPQRRMVGPFIFFDHMGPAEFAAGIPLSVDVRPHPHVGLATVTYLFEGEIMHRDSVGSELPIRPGEVNWMTAGRGITHSERFEHARREGGRLDGIQAWVALPADKEDVEPAFAHFDAPALPAIELAGTRWRLIAGAALGRCAPVPVHSPLFYLHGEMPAETTCALDIDYPERAVYVAEGRIELEGTAHDAGHMIVVSPGAPITLRALAKSRLMLLGGEPVGERFIDWNFVATSKERIERAKADWRAGRFKLPDTDNQEFIPLP